METISEKVLTAEDPVLYVELDCHENEVTSCSFKLWNTGEQINGTSNGLRTQFPGERFYAVWYIHMNRFPPLILRISTTQEIVPCRTNPKLTVAQCAESTTLQHRKTRSLSWEELNS